MHTKRSQLISKFRSGPFPPLFTARKKQEEATIQEISEKFDAQVEDSSHLFSSEVLKFLSVEDQLNVALEVGRNKTLDEIHLIHHKNLKNILMAHDLMIAFENKGLTSEQVLNAFVEKSPHPFLKVAFKHINNRLALSKKLGFMDLTKKLELLGAVILPEDHPDYEELLQVIDLEIQDEVERIISQGVSIDYRCRHGNTILHNIMAKESTSENFIRKYVSFGANVNAQNLLGFSPLHMAVCNDQPLFARILMENGANPNHKDLEGNTPLHVVSFLYPSPQREIMKVLIEFGADLHLQNLNGKSPYDFFLSRDHTFSTKIYRMARSKSHCLIS